MAGGVRKNADSPLALALARGQNVQEAAQAAGVSERTAYRRQTDPAFRRQVAELRAEMVRRAMGQLVEASTAAVETLKDLLESPHDAVALGAARAILQSGTVLRESIDLEARLVALEERFAA